MVWNTQLVLSQVNQCDAHLNHDNNRHWHRSKKTFGLFLQLHHWETRVQEHRLFSGFAKQESMYIGVFSSSWMLRFFIYVFFFWCFCFSVSTLSASCFLCFRYFSVCPDGVFSFIGDTTRPVGCRFRAYEWPILIAVLFAALWTAEAKDPQIARGWDPHMDRSWSLPSWLRCRKSWTKKGARCMGRWRSKFSPKLNWLVVRGV